MDLSGASLSDLVAELRERLRHFAVRPPGDQAAETAPGPLTPPGRAALAARLLAVVLSTRRGHDAAEAARAFEDLAAALAAAPAPLPASAWEADLGLLAHTLESIAGAWDRGQESELADLWLSLRGVGDRLWAVEAPARAPATEGEAAPAGAVNAGTDARAARHREGEGREVWLLVAGPLRRDSLRRRLTSVGLRVRHFDDVEVALGNLGAAAPAAIICDDAAPARFRSRLRGRLPRPAPPVILVRSRGGAVDPGAAVWLPPYDTAELLAHLRR